MYIIRIPLHIKTLLTTFSFYLLGSFALIDSLVTSLNAIPHRLPQVKISGCVLVRYYESILLETTALHNGMILSTLSISSHIFTFGYPKMPHSNEDVFYTYKPMIIPLISRCGTPYQQSSTILPELSTP